MGGEGKGWGWRMTTGGPMGGKDDPFQIDEIYSL